MNTTKDEIKHLVQKVVTETASIAVQATNYAVKHQDFTDSHPEYRMGWIVGSKVCHDAIRPHIISKRAKIDAITEGFYKDHSSDTDLEKENANLRKENADLHQIIVKINEIMIPLASNRRFMQIAGPARQCLNLTKPFRPEK
jgi:wobble nucleotide-excising tRNase